jgi:hypothetical protein
MLPEDVLLEIFDFYVDEDLDEDLDEADSYPKDEIDVWQTLVHVCRRWRRVVFGSPRRLNLRLLCSSKTPARDRLDVWPSLPLLIRASGFHLDWHRHTKDMDNIIAVLERSDRVVKIDLFNLDGSESENVLAAMKVPIPELTVLALHSTQGRVSVLPNSFLGGSTPRLQDLYLHRIPFPGLSKLLLSATHLVTLRLVNIPHSGYISPDAMVTALATLTRLDRLQLYFESPRSCPDWASRRPPPPTRSVLPVLTRFEFKGVCEYLEDLVAHIDAPRLNILEVTFFNQIVFDTPQFLQFISRMPNLETFQKTNVAFRYDTVSIDLSSRTSGYGNLNVTIPCRELDWQVSAMEQICTLCLPPLSTLEDIYIYGRPYLQVDRQGNIENTLWLELLQPFTSVKNLHLSGEFARRIALALQELGGARTTAVLPSLQNIFLEGLQPSGTVQEGIQKFVAARQVTSHPIAVSHWDRDQDTRWY